jgi:hypothetical protein
MFSSYLSETHCHLHRNDQLVNTVTRRTKAGRVKSEMFIAKQLLGKHIPAATNTQATTE